MHNYVAKKATYRTLDVVTVGKGGETNTLQGKHDNDNGTSEDDGARLCVFFLKRRKRRRDEGER